MPASCPVCGLPNEFEVSVFRISPFVRFVGCLMRFASRPICRLPHAFRLTSDVWVASCVSPHVRCEACLRILFRFISSSSSCSSCSSSIISSSSNNSSSSNSSSSISSSSSSSLRTPKHPQREYVAQELFSFTVCSSASGAVGSKPTLKPAGEYMSEHPLEGASSKSSAHSLPFVRPERRRQGSNPRQKGPCRSHGGLASHCATDAPLHVGQTLLASVKSAPIGRLNVSALPSMQSGSGANRTQRVLIQGGKVCPWL
ncbi:hypothetical protein PoB_004724900 [Plakobranchus ocellatus]|uniref:Uncharacterized protein n=1 Tax=Plakobranchus ocellatus TaxID=259542 RepID=A0AAV4BQX5_9GAST|nr:hypothetical protein PoB_004724900 [Plakobranchus ocellatus]